MLATPTTPVTITFEIESGRYSPAFLAAVTGRSAWSREARIVLALAAARGIRLDESQLIMEDVYGLRARRDALTGSPAR
jgi:hypothetical protein